MSATPGGWPGAACLDDLAAFGGRLSAAIRRGEAFDEDAFQDRALELFRLQVNGGGEGYLCSKFNLQV